MKLVQIWLICSIALKELSCQTITTNSSNLANHKQQYLIKGSMDLNAKPCEDFYQYACGKWENFYRAAGDKYYETISFLDYKVNIEMANFFNRSNLQDQPKFVKTAFQFFKSCDNLEVYKTVHYLNWMKEVENMKFPPLGRVRQKQEKYDWLVMLAKMRIYGMNGVFIQERVVHRDEDPYKFIMYLHKPDIGDDFTYLTKDDLEEIIANSGESIDIIKLWSEIEAFEVDLKKLLGNYGDSNEEYADDDMSLVKVKDIPLPWLKNYIKILLNQTELNPNSEIYLKDIPYFTALDKLLKEQSQRFLCKYLQIRFLWHLHIEGPSDFIAEECVRQSRKLLPSAMHWLYEQKHPELQLEFPKIIELYEAIRKQFNKTLQQNYHKFNETVVNNLLAKLSSMQLKLNNIPRKETVQTLDKLYHDLDLNDHDFYANHLKLLKFNCIIVHNQIVSNTTQQMDFLLEESDNGARSSLYFNHEFNTLVVPLTILQWPIYQSDSDNVFKYSSLGFLLANWMFDGFDSYGIDIDHNGVRIEQRYEDILTNPLFNARFNCASETESSQKIADINALSYAYQMFNDSRTNCMDVPSSRLFFLNFAQYFCGSSDSDKFVDQETPDRERLANALINFPEFSKVFQCGSSNRMHPPDTPCDI